MSDKTEFESGEERAASRNFFLGFSGRNVNAFREDDEPEEIDDNDNDPFGVFCQ